MTMMNDDSHFDSEPRNLPVSEPRYRIPNNRRHRRAARSSKYEKAVIGLSIVSSLMATLAAFGLLEGSGLSHSLKCLLVGLAMGLLGITVNTAAIRSGSVQAALGMWTGWALFAVMIATGVGLFSFTTSGLLLHPVEYRRLAEHGERMAAALAAAESSAQDRQSRAAALDVVRSGQVASEASEVEGATTSGRKSGRGPVARQLGDNVRATRDLQDLLRAGANASAEKITEARRLLSDYRARHAKGGANLRGDLQDLDTKFRATLGEIVAVMPIAAIEAHILSLEQPQIIVGNEQASRSLTDARKADAAILKQSIASLKSAETLPLFPARTGAPETMEYLATFAPITIGVLVIDLVLPAAMFLLNFGWLRLRIEQDDDTPPDNDGDDGRDVDLLSEASGGVVRSIRDPARVRLIQSTQGKG